jgi:anti-sigma factor RsiW
MNDETRELLSAYLDGALPEAERRELDARLAVSAELRGALEDLRAVSRAVKDLPKEPLPPGFMARFQARRARGDAPRRDWVFLPPEARPVVAALSIGVVALVIWDKVTVAPEQPFLHPPETAKVFDAANAPVAQLDLSRAARESAAGAAAGAGGGAGLSAGKFGALSDAKSLEIESAAAPPRAQASDKLAYLQTDDGRADSEMKAAAKPSVAAMRGSSARAKGSPISLDGAPGAAGSAAAPSAEPQLTDRTRPTMTEEERSARNEQMFSQLEGQKKKMGMKVLSKDEAGPDAEHRGFLGLREPPVAPAIRAPMPTLLKSAKSAGGNAAVAAQAAPLAAPAGAAGRLAPDAALVFTDARSLASSWVLLGLPGDPPAMDFANGRLVMIKPSATKILSVTPGPDAVTVVYRALLPDEESDPARDRVAPLPVAPKSVLIYDASPR